jgi:hypothetical protein
MGHASMGYHYGGYPGGMAVVPPSQCAAAAVSLGSSDRMNSMTQAEMMGGNARKRESPEVGCTDKMVERRQRRMIKIRESAARSRARKQVCTSLLSTCFAFFFKGRGPFHIHCDYGFGGRFVLCMCGTVAGLYHGA